MPLSQPVVFLAWMMLCLIGYATPADSALTAYDCSKDTSSAFDVPILKLLPSCNEIVYYYTTIAKIIERKNYRTPVIDAYLCKVTTNRSIVDFAGSSRVISVDTEYTDRQTCLNAHMHRKIQVAGGKYIEFLDTNGTTTHTVLLANSSNWPTAIRQSGELFIQSYNVTLRKTTGTVDLKQDIITFEDGTKCDYSATSCEHDGSRTFWNNSDANPQLTDTASSEILYVGETMIVGTDRNRTSTGDPLRYAVVQRDDKTTFVIRAFDYIADREYRTEIANVRIVLIGNADRFSSFEKRKLFSKDYGWKIDSDALNEFGKKTHEAVLPTLRFHVSDAVDLGRQRCQHDAADIFRRLDTVRVGSRVEFSEKGVLTGMVAVRIGKNTFSMYGCDLSEVRTRETDQCYEHVPVKDMEGRDKFLNIISRVLMDDASPVSCESLNNTFELDFYINEQAVVLVPNCDLASDWFKISLIVIVSLVGVCVLVRITKVTLRRFRREECGQEDSMVTLISRRYTIQHLKNNILGGFVKE